MCVECLYICVFINLATSNNDSWHWLCCDFSACRKQFFQISLSWQRGMFVCLFVRSRLSISMHIAYHTQLCMNAWACVQVAAQAWKQLQWSTSSAKCSSRAFLLQLKMLFAHLQVTRQLSTASSTFSYRYATALPAHTHTHAAHWFVLPSYASAYLQCALACVAPIVRAATFWSRRALRSAVKAHNGNNFTMTMCK